MLLLHVRIRAKSKHTNLGHAQQNHQINIIIRKGLSFPGRGTTLSDQHHHHQGQALGYTGQVNKHRGTASAVYSPGTSSRTQAE
jgi:hypothetical protein